MITWMQRHKKWLIITIWISTIAFIGAGFVGWGQYKYGDKAGAVAKVGDIEISVGELQKEYSNLYARYNQMFQGNFDTEKAKQFGLQKQALQQLLQKALILNLAQSYDLIVSDEELFKAIESQKAFYKDGHFDKNIYKQVLSQNRMSIKEYETALRKELLIQKVFTLLPVKASQNEKNIINTLISIADKLNYKVLTPDDIKVTVDDKELQKFWENIKEQFKTEVLYSIRYIKQTVIHKDYDETKLTQYYNDNKTHFKAKDGKILPFEEAKQSVIAELDAKATKDKALRSYIAFKKGKLDANTTVSQATLSASHNQFGEEAYKKISSLSKAKPFSKPVAVDGVYYIFELVSLTPAQTKSFEKAKAEVTPLYVEQLKKQKLLELAKTSLKNFQGTQTDFITLADAQKITLLTPQEASEFLQNLFMSDKKTNFIPLKDGKIVLYSIMEQKLLNKTNDKNNAITNVKGSLFNEGLLKTLQNKYQTEIFMKGL